MDLTLLRHAPPSIAYQGRYLGHTDIPIDPELFTPISLPHTYDAIYSSDLLRCTQSLEALGYVDVITDKRLREVRFKERFELKSFAEIEKMEGYHPCVLDSQEAWHDFVCDESREAFAGRVASFLDDLPREGKVLICSHGGTIAAILTFLKCEPQRLDYLEYTIVTVK
jgi:alpha-ribazole phosphatase